jgi:hypothetical protein
MRSLKTLLVAALVLGTVGAAQAELQNVEVGGSVRIRGNWFDFDQNPFINGGEDSTFVEQRTRLNVKADFTDEVSVFIEFDAYDNWGDSFRANPYTGLDLSSDAFGNDDIDLYQSYIQINNAWGLPITTKIGRQEIELGSEWLVGNQDASSIYTGLSFDGVTSTYTADAFTVTAMSLKLNESFEDFGDGDVNLYGVYGSYIGLEDWQFDAYWLYVTENEDDRTGVAPVANGVFGLGTSDADLHTIGLRGAGTYGAFDLESEVAFQFGDVERLDPGFFNFFGDNDLDYDAFAFNLEAGYTFDITWTPRVYLGAAFFEGGDQGQNNGFFGGNNNDLGFNRLFSNWEYSEFLENGELSNSIIYRAGVSAMPTEKISLLLAATYFQADEETDGFNFLWWNDSSDDNEGIEVGLYGDYQYSEDLVFRAGYAHFFGDDGVEDGNFVANNGLALFLDDNDGGEYNYLFWEAEISF